MAPPYGIGNACDAYFAVLPEKIQKNVQDFNSWGNMDTEVP